VEFYAGAVPIHRTPVVVDPEETSSLFPYSAHSYSFLSVPCSVDAADDVASRSDLEGNVKQSVQL
jgi:hypothetical protein